MRALTAPTWAQWLALNWPLLLALNEIRGLWTVYELGKFGVASHSLNVLFG